MSKKSATSKKTPVAKKSASAKKVEYPIPEVIDDLFPEDFVSKETLFPEPLDEYGETVILDKRKIPAKGLMMKKESILPGRFLFAEGVSRPVQKICCNLWYTQAASKNMNTTPYEFGSFSVLVVPAIEKSKRLIQFTVTYTGKPPQKYRSFEEDLFRNYPSFESLFM